MNEIRNVKKILLVVLIILILVITWRFSTILYFPDSGIVLQKGETVKIRSEESVMQKFSANRNGLSKIEVLLRTPGIEHKNGDEVIMKIMEENCQSVIREGSLEKSFLSADNLYEFTFERISDSDKKNYCLSATFSPKKHSAKAIQIYTQGDEKNQPYSIRPGYKNSSLFQDASEINKRLSQYKPFFLKHYFLWIVVIGFIILSVGTVIILIAL